MNQNRLSPEENGLLFKYALDNTLYLKPKQLYLALKDLGITFKGSEASFRQQWQRKRDGLVQFAKMFLEQQNKTGVSLDINNISSIEDTELLELIKKYGETFSDNAPLALKLGLLLFEKKDHKNSKRKENDDDLQSSQNLDEVPSPADLITADSSSSSSPKNKRKKPRHTDKQLLDLSADTLKEKKEESEIMNDHLE